MSKQFTLRITDALKTELVKAAQKSGRSLSEECQWRLTLTCLDDDELKGIAMLATMCRKSSDE